MKGRKESKVSTWVLSDWTMQRNLSSATHTMVSEDMKAATQGKVLIRLASRRIINIVMLRDSSSRYYVIRRFRPVQWALGQCFKDYAISISIL